MVHMVVVVIEGCLLDQTVWPNVDGGAGIHVHLVVLPDTLQDGKIVRTWDSVRQEKDFVEPNVHVESFPLHVAHLSNS